MLNNRRPSATAVATIAVLGAIALCAYALIRLDQRPRTHDGFLLADTAHLAPEVSGRIDTLYVRDNQYVRKGTPLLRIDPEPFLLRERQVKGQVEALRAQIDLTARQVTAQTSGAAAATSLVGKARAQLQLARDTVERLEPLLGKGFVTEQQVDEARTNARSAEVALEAALQQALQARQAITDTQSLIAQEHSAEAQEALAARDRRNTTLVAPFDGVIVGLTIAEGEYAAAGHPLFTLIKTNAWYAIGNFRETELAHIQIGDPAVVWVMSDNGRPLTGRVESIGWGVRPEDTGVPGLPAVGRTLSWVIVAQRFPVRVLLDNPPPRMMRIGATTTIAVHPDARR